MIKYLDYNFIFWEQLPSTKLHEKLTSSIRQQSSLILTQNICHKPWLDSYTMGKLQWMTFEIEMHKQCHSNKFHLGNRLDRQDIALNSIEDHCGWGSRFLPDSICSSRSKTRISCKPQNKGAAHQLKTEFEINTKHCGHAT